MNSINIILLCVVFLVVQQGTDAINCYICSAGTDGCGTPFKKTGGGVVPTSNSSIAAYCIKDVYSSNTNAINHYYGSSCTEGSGVDATYNSFPITRYCCSTDLCNKASMGKASFIFAVVSAVIGLLLIK